MLSLVTDNFEVLTADVDERAAEVRMEEEGVPALKVSEHLAEIKAKAVYDSLSDEEKENSIVIGADTSVILDNIIFGKPADREEAVNMLSLLSGHTHVVATGVAVFEGGKKKTFTEETRVEFNALDDYQIIQESINSIWNDAALIAAREAYETAVEDVEKWKTAFDVLANSGDTPQSAAYKNAKSAFESAEEAYLQARQTLRDKIANNENTITGYNIDLADLWQQITKTKEKLEDLLGGEEAQITAKVSGTIQTLNAAPGDTKKKDDVLATIEVPDMGYMMSFSVTNDQASRLRVGDTGTVSNFYWGDEITATLKSIQIDQKNPATNKLLTFDLSGNVTAGSELTVSVGQKSANYDVIIPSSSVRTDANGTYVLKMESKNSPLGNRYLARRVPVEVLAVDDTNSAVSADLGYGDYVITSSSAPLKNGQMVRLATSS